MAELLGDDDPSSVEQLNADSRVPLLLLCDHASNAIPAALNQLGLSDEVLKDSHTAWDIGAADVTRRLAERFGAHAVLAGYSRLVIDCNRQPGDPSSIPAISDDIVVPGNQNLNDADAQARADACFWPYHQRLGDSVAQLWRHGPPPALVVIHSFTPTFGGLQRPWQLGLLWNRDPRLFRLIARWFDQHQPDVCVGDNEPYSARDIAFTLDRHAGAAGLPHIGLEIRQDLISDDAGCAHWAELIGDALEATLSSGSLHHVEHF